MVCLMLVAMAALCLMGVAAAATDPITFAMELSNTRFNGPAEVTVTIRITNSGSEDMPAPLGLFDPAGQPITSFGTPTLKAGSSKEYTGTWMVTEKQLAEGKLHYGVRYPVSDGAGSFTYKDMLITHNIVDAGDEPVVEIRRHIAPTMARKGQNVSVIYEISNVGNVDITDVEIKEATAVSKSVGRIALVRAGEKATHTFTVKMGTRKITSSAAITYKANGETYKASVDKADIRYGDVKLDATLKADKKGGNPGDTLTLTLTVKNSGKSDYENVTVTDPTLGTVFTGLTVKAGETITEEKSITITESAEFVFTVSGADASGATVETATGVVSITAVDPDKVVDLTVEAVADRSTVYVLPGIVKFTVKVTNNSPSEAKDVSVSASGVTLYTFDTIQPGQTRTFVRDVRVEIPGTFRFDAAIKDQLDQTVIFESNHVRIEHARPTATPSPAPIATPAKPVTEPLPTRDSLPPYVDTVEQALSIASWVLLALSGVCLALVAVGVVSRVRRAAQSSKASDHLERDGFRDYTRAVPERRRHAMPEEEQADETPYAPVEEEAAAEEEAPVQEELNPSEIAEAMTEIYPDAAPAQDAEQAPEENSFPQEETYRRRRRADEE